MCQVAGCEKEVHSRGYCQPHYHLFKKYGKPETLAPELRKKPGPLAKPKLEATSRPLTTHCLNGHERNEENTYTYNGDRHCRVCQKERMRERRVPGLGQGGFNAAKTRCPQGHEYTEENTYTNPQGRRMCKACAGVNAKKQSIKKHKISLTEFTSVVERQNYECPICHSKLEKYRGAIDHDHTCCPGNTSCGMCIRGVICRPCNTGLGMFRDNPELLRSAALYIESYLSRTPTQIPD